ncbi:CubicO group peptidase (beta-lactamase class C family) [Yoonia maritima]|uniref:CubicO group peptidase (Beta-lactamase class C family) n=1 Tax=Yoonia maritima TaxID=1435347 RepID=A0A2T0W4L8_9RHOB|nr:serine hydrolase domain-containing protein [Yoonia maritima]PRY80419.1 CubicO group peptidase (beta-lactamase class C family) [Yoonia maritima]
MSNGPMHTYWVTRSGSERSTGAAEATFPYWSFTKTVLAIAALQLVERGQLDLDANIDGQSFSLRQLLMHTAGLPDYGSVPAYQQAVAKSEKPWPREVMLRHALKNGALFAPGDGWSYSNIGYMYVLEEMEKAANAPVVEVLSTLIFEPLGAQSVKLAQEQSEFAETHWDAAKRYHPRWVYHGCLIGTASDAVKILHGLFCGQLLGTQILAQMLVTYPLGGPIPGRPWATCGYGLGLMSGEITGLGRVFGHSGVGPFCVNTVMHFYDRDDSMTVAAFTDGTDEGVTEYAAAKIALDR